MTTRSLKHTARLVCLGTLSIFLVISGIKYWWQHHISLFDSQIWWEYEERYHRNTTSKPLLPDFSYSGYRLQAELLPPRAVDGASGTANRTEDVFNVVDFGAVGDGIKYCAKAVNKAIRAAKKNGGGVVYFPPGRYRFGQQGNTESELQITSSNITLRGAGNSASAETSSILYLDHYIPGNKFLLYGHGHHHPGPVEEAAGVHVVASVPAEAIKLHVSDVSDYSAGDCFRLHGNSKAWLTPWFGDIPLDPKWEDLSKQGITFDQPHCVAHVNHEASVLTLNSPIHTEIVIKKDQTSLKLLRIQMLSDIGIEMLRFESGWKKEKKPLCHLCDDKNTLGWQAILLTLVKDSYIRDCVFDSWIGSVKLEMSRANTVSHNAVVGKPGHHCYRTLRSYGNLFLENSDTAGTWHGPSFEMFDSGSVFLRHKLARGQAVDAHGNLPTHTLVDGASGGVLYGAGGNEMAFPNHAEKLTIWNFEHRAVDVRGKKYRYRFWPIDLENPYRFSSVFHKPIIVGLKGDREIEIDTTTVLYGEGLHMQRPSPASLFDAQLKLRLADSRNNSVPIYFTPSDMLPKDHKYSPTRAFEYRIQTDYHPKVIYHDHFKWLRYMVYYLCAACVGLCCLKTLWSYCCHTRSEQAGGITGFQQVPMQDFGFYASSNELEATRT